MTNSFTLQELTSTILLAIILFFRLFSVIVVLPVFSIYALDLQQATAFTVGLAFGGYAFTQGLMQIPLGILSDVWSRKGALILGLLLFASGCFISGYSESIYLMIIGRLLQGTGAISSIIFASLADAVRDEYRIRAMAILGMAAGLAFAVAFSSSSILVYYLGLGGLFKVLGTVSIASALGLLFWRPNLKPAKVQSLKQILDNFKTIRQDQLWFYLAVAFVVSFGLSVFMYYFPLQLAAGGVVKSSFWMYYVPLLLIGVVATLLAAIIAEKYRRLALVFTLSLICVWLGPFLAINVGGGLVLNSGLVIIGCYVFFIGFSAFEPILPSIILKKATTVNRGQTSGMLALFQFFGNFFGALIAGSLYNNVAVGPFLIIFLMAIFLIFINWKIKVAT